jgi:hypothetical protein
LLARELMVCGRAWVSALAGQTAARRSLHYARRVCQTNRVKIIALSNCAKTGFIAVYHRLNAIYNGELKKLGL